MLFRWPASERTLQLEKPCDVLYRPKMGFGASMLEWLRGDFGRQAESAVLGSGMMDGGYFRRDWIAACFGHHREGRKDHASYLWMLFNLAACHDHWIAGN